MLFQSIYLKLNRIELKKEDECAHTIKNAYTILKKQSNKRIKFYSLISQIIEIDNI